MRFLTRIFYYFGLSYHAGMHVVATVVVLACWIVWPIPFLLRARQQRGRRSVVMAPAAKWGVGIQAVAYFFVWLIVRGYGFHATPWLVLAMICGLAGATLAWAAVGRLGRQWRIQAGLFADHELVETGPYSLVRHPIYAAMILMFLSRGLLTSPWYFFLPALVLLIAGTEIRVRAEERLLRTRFGERFESYRSRVSAYVPFVR